MVLLLLTALLLCGCGGAENLLAPAIEFRAALVQAGGCSFTANITADNAGVSLIASLITLMPPLLIFLSGQKYLEQGIISSGMKD